jgi:hypothetical protein
VAELVDDLLWLSSVDRLEELFALRMMELDRFAQRCTSTLRQNREPGSSAKVASFLSDYGNSYPPVLPLPGIHLPR